VPKSVLIVDDHEAVRRELRRLFQSQPDFTVCGEAVDGVDAISKAEQLSPDLVILDLAMPEMNGLEAAGALRFIMPDGCCFCLLLTRIESWNWRRFSQVCARYFLNTTI